MGNVAEVEAFLCALKEKITVFDIAFRPRDKNRIALAELDILPVDRIRYIMNLRPENYCTGPNKDSHDPRRPDYYEFGVTIREKEVYIKISMGLHGKMVDCMSFHPAEFPITYPLKGK